MSFDGRGNGIRAVRGDSIEHSSVRAVYASQACERCRRRKQRCSGSMPCCESCRKTNLPCRYSENKDRRKLVVGWRQENNVLRKRVAYLESCLARSIDPSSSTTPLRSLPSEKHFGPYEPQAYFGPTDDDNLSCSSWKSAEFEPFGTGALVLDANGKLHLNAEATFYRPCYFPTHTQKHRADEDLRRISMSSSTSSMYYPGPLTHKDRITPASLSDENLRRSSTDESSWPTDVHCRKKPYQAPHLPFPMSKHEHARLLDLFFNFTPSFGMNSFREQFQAEMQRDCTRSQAYFSPLLHLVALAIGSRYDLSQKHASISTTYTDRGALFFDRARQIVDEESEKPSLGTIIGLIMLSIYCFGMMADQAATNFYAVAVFLAQEFRLHRRCDKQLFSLGKAPDDELDVARRDVYGLVHNFSSWWMNYFARTSLNFSMEADQRLPFQRQGSTIDHIISTAFRYHCSLSEIGHELVFCQHSWRTTPMTRLAYVKKLSGDLVQWRQSLPKELQWPQASEAPILHSSVASLLAMYNAYVIELHRPYISCSPEHETWLDARELCNSATDEMIELIRFIRDFHGVRSAPLTMQQMIHVAGTMLILQASGLGDPPSTLIAKAHRNLLYLLRWLDEFSEIWPAASQTAESLRMLSEEHCFSSQR